MQMDARNSASGEIVFKDNFSQAVAGIVEVSWLFCLICNFFVALFLCLQCFDTVGWAAGRASGL